jgi:hypothetical protein
MTHATTIGMEDARLWLLRTNCTSLGSRRKLDTLILCLLYTPAYRWLFGFDPLSAKNTMYK